MPIFWTMESLTLVIYRWWIDWIKWNLMPNRSLITVNSTKASLALVPLSHPLFSSTKPPFHLFHRTTLRFVSDSTLSSALQSRSSVCSTYHPIRLFHKATLFFVDWVTPFLQRVSFVCLTATFVFVSFTDLPFRLLHRSFSLLHRPALLFASQRNLSLPKSQPRFHRHSEASQAFIAVSLSWRIWLESHIHYLWFDILNWNLHSRKKVG